MAGTPVGFALVAVDRYIARYTVGFTDQAGGPFTRTHAELMADMVEGPLKDLWDVSDLVDDADGRQRLMYDSHARIETEVTVLNGNIACSAVAAPDGSDAPTVVATLGGAIEQGALVILVTLEYRHSTGR